MYIREDRLDGLGFIDPISNAFFTGAAIKNVLGIGKKKRARKDMEAQSGGVYTSQFPAGVDWDRLLDKPNTNVIRGKQSTSREAYNWMRGRNDSQLVKTNVATPEDYMAYVVQQWIGSSIGCDPNAKKGSQRYGLCPTDKQSGINIYDTALLKAYYAKKKQAAAPKVKAVVVKPARAVAVPAAPVAPVAPVAPAYNPFQFIQPRQPAAPMSFQQPAPQITVTAPAAPAPRKNYLLEGALVVGSGLALYMLTSGRKRKR